MNYAYLFEEFYGASGDAKPLFVLDGSAAEAGKVELAFQSAGKNMIMPTRIKIFSSFEDIESYLNQKKTANLEEINKKSPFAWVESENE